MNEAISTKRVVIINTLVIIFAVILAIVIKSFLPADVNVEDFDSTIVKLIGFPAVATLYFVILYLHCVMVVHYFGKKSKLPKLQIGLRFGIVFASLYLFGMQEVIVETSPYKEWGLSFVRYQFFIGITDALPALLLCLVTSYFIINDKNTSSPTQFLNLMEKIKIVTLVTITFLIQRAIGYETGMIGSNSSAFPIPTYLWTIVFGFVLGLSYVYLYPILFRGQSESLISLQIVVITIGGNWILFNSFIGLIFSGVMSQMILRTGIDVSVFHLTVVIVHKYFIKADRR